MDHKFEVRTQANASITKQVGDRATFVLTSGGCSCDLYAPKRDNSKVVSNKLITSRIRYTKLGWSAAKIERALAARRSEPNRKHGFVGLREDVCEIVARIAEAANEVALLILDYSTNIDMEIMPPLKTITMAPEGLRSSRTRLQEDVVIWVRTGYI